MSHYYDDCYAVLKEADVFPIEVDLSRTMMSYSSQSLSSYAGDEEEDEEEETVAAAVGGGGVSEDGGSRQAENGAEKLIDDE